MNLKKSVIAITILGAALILVSRYGLYQSGTSSKTEKSLPAGQNPEPQVVSTNPADQGTALANQPIEITFNMPLENSGELKNRLEPKTDYKIELSTDRKTARFIPKTSWGLGSSYTVFILADTKFDGKKLFNRDFILHFKTISYQGV